ncbi:hypothetical protein D9M71_581050 [compost metagenome]
MPGAQHQIDLAEVQALHVDEAVDQVQLHIEPGVEHQEIGNHRCQVPATKGCRRIDTNQAFRRAAQGHRLGPGQAQFGDDPPCALGKGQSRRRGAYRMRAAQEQLTADRAFQAVDTPCHGRRGQRMTARGGGKTAGFQHVEEQGQLVGQLIGVHGRFVLVRIWHSHCALLCVSVPEATA